MTTIDPLTADDLARKEEILSSFRRECAYSEVEMSSEFDLDILRHIRYEGVNGSAIEEVIASAQGLVVGDFLVRECGCNWCMIISGTERHFAIEHDSFARRWNMSFFKWSDAKKRFPRRWIAKLRPLP
ncbi:MAG: hypothetical protein KDA44_18130 [Planctomycetales bacterium]|nr:hypothetical protein [Planctomycetales bacterium]